MLRLSKARPGCTRAGDVVTFFFRLFRLFRPAFHGPYACIIEDLASDWHRLDKRIKGLSSEIESLARQDAGCE